MTTIGIIGSGQIGMTVARLAVRAGHRIVLSNSRGPETLAGAVAELGPKATAATSADAATAGDIVVISVPVAAFGNLPTAVVHGKTVIDTCNYGPERDGPIAELDDGSVTSSALLQRHLPGAAVVKVFNNIFYKHLLALARPTGANDRSVLPLAGDSDAAKLTVTGLLDSIGYDALDAGALADSWHQETGTPVWGTPYGPYSQEQGAPADAETIRAALAAATR